MDGFHFDLTYIHASTYTQRNKNQIKTTTHTHTHMLTILCQRWCHTNQHQCKRFSFIIISNIGKWMRNNRDLWRNKEINLNRNRDKHTEKRRERENEMNSKQKNKQNQNHIANDRIFGQSFVLVLSHERVSPVIQGDCTIFQLSECS